MSDDVVARSKTLMERRRYPCRCGEPTCYEQNPRELAALVPELVAEIERLRMAEVERKR